jgi:hypothetical protein
MPGIIYFRWAYSPSTGVVTLSHNHEAGPADIKYHSMMGTERSEPDLEVGYASKLADNKWQVMDADFKPVNDLHVIMAVEDKIREDHPTA